MPTTPERELSVEADTLHREGMSDMDSKSSNRSTGATSRTVILPFAGSAHRASRAEQESIRRVREITEKTLQGRVRRA